MSEEQTRNVRNDNQVLQQILTKLEVMDTRLQFVETKVSERGYDTKPIWERALAEIMDVKHELTIINRKMDVFSRDMLSMRAEQLSTDERLRHLEG
jgi:hypothetical protein